MPRSPYTRFKNAGTNKLSTPMARFTLMKYYLVTMPTPSVAPAPAAVLRISNGTPFQPLTAISGGWIANDSNNEVAHIGEKPWTGYNHLVVAGSRVEAVIKDSVDNAASGSNDQLEGIVRITRAGGSGVVNGSTTNTQLRDVAYSKGRALQLGSTVNALPKNASIRMGYSAKKIWNANPMGQDQLRVTNTSGSNNAPADDTYTFLSIHLANENLANKTLKPFKVQLKVTYFIKFQEPNVSINIPRPIPTKSDQKKKAYKRYKLGVPSLPLLNPKGSYQRDFYSAIGVAALAYAARRR